MLDFRDSRYDDMRFVTELSYEELYVIKYALEYLAIDKRDEARSWKKDGDIDGYNECNEDYKKCLQVAEKILDSKIIKDRS